MYVSCLSLFYQLTFPKVEIFLPDGISNHVKYNTSDETIKRESHKIEC